MQQGDTRTEPTRERNALLASARINWRAVALLLIVVALVVTRLGDLGNRSYSHDESIHAWDSWKLATGQRYVHDPVYHGPFLYHLTALVYTILGATDVTARLGPALLAVVAVLLIWPLRRWLGRAGALWAMLLLTISPTMMFRGRFIRHDIFVIVPSLVMVICFFRYQEDRQERWLYLIAGALSLTFCAKANAFINGAIFGSFWLIHLLAERLRSGRPLRELPSFDLVMLMATLALPLASPVLVRAMGHDPLDYSQTGLIRTLVVVVMMLAISMAIGTWWKEKVWLTAAGIYYTIFFLLYTTLFTNPQGAATGIVGMLGYWLSQQDVARGGQPWYYYLFLLVVYEALPFLVSGLAAVYYLFTKRRSSTKAELSGRVDSVWSVLGRDTFVLFMLYWALLNLVIFTWTSEKMPWQMQHIVLPLGLLAGWFLGRIWDGTNWRALWVRGAAQAAVLLPVGLLAVVVLVGTPLGSGGPFEGVALSQLQVTMKWLLALSLFLLSAALMYRGGRSLGRSGWSRVILVAFLVASAALTLRTALRLSFINQDYATEFLVYAASTPDTGAVMRELDDMSARMAGDKELRVAYDNESQQPYFWYLRDYGNSSFFAEGGSPASDAEVVIVGSGNEGKIKSQLLGKYLRREYRLIWWPNQDVYSNLTPLKLWRDLLDPARRAFWWDILWSRRYPQPTTSWPYVHRFALYVRKEIAAQLWDYGPEVAGVGIALPQDEYDEKRIEVSALFSFGSQGSAPGQLNYPKGVALDQQGNVYVADSSNHRVQVFDTDGGFLREWGTQGSAPGQFQEPWGIAVDAAGYVYVADTWNHRIQKFDSQGALLQYWGRFGDTSGVLGDHEMLYGPRAVAIAGDGSILVSDTGNKRVLKFTPDGQFIQQTGGAGSLNGQFREPAGVAVDLAGNVYVADTWNQRLQELDAYLDYQGQWPVVGWEGEGVTNKPYLAVGSGASVYVTAPDYHWLVKFDATGKVEAVWGRYGSDLASFNMPSGVAVDADDHVYVADSANHRVLKFAPVQ